MMFSVLVFFISIVNAKVALQPEGCLSQADLLDECRVLSYTKSVVKLPQSWGGILYTSANSYFELQKDHRIYISRGAIWGKTDGALQIQTPYGKFVQKSAGDFWIQFKDKMVIFRSMSGEAEVVAKDEIHGQKIFNGFEIHLKAVSYNKGRVEASLPTSIRLMDHLKGLDLVFPYNKLDFQKEVQRVSLLVVEATKEASEWHKKIVERKIANYVSVREKQQKEAQQRSYMERYFRQIYRQKNNID